MTQEKHSRIIAAITVNVILLIAILAIVCIYQLVEMTTLRNLKNDMQVQINSYNEQIKSDRAALDYFQSEEGLLDKAYEWGFRYAK